MAVSEGIKVWTWCLPPGPYTIVAHDSRNNSWWGGTATVVVYDEDSRSVNATAYPHQL